MILSVSRRTDIPHYYTEWFLQRLQEGYVCVRNPLNKRQVTKVEFTPATIDCIVFWTKDPAPLMLRLGEVKDYCYYFQFTLNAYEKEIEAGLLPNSARIDVFRRLSASIGRERVIWRYDPIVISPRYDAAFHIAQFSSLAKKLSGHTEKCVVSFVDFYRINRDHLQRLKARQPDHLSKEKLLGCLAKIAGAYGIRMETCAEEGGFSHLGIQDAHCIDAALIERLTGNRLRVEKDKNQRPACGCAASLDIGAYGTCFSGCVYCYANHNGSSWRDMGSPLLGSVLEEGDVIKIRSAVSGRELQGRLF